MIKFKHLIESSTNNSPEFQKWFGHSKVVDRRGDPLVVYHGTSGNFKKFDKEKIGSATNTLVRGFFFTDSEDVARGFGNKVIAAYLSIQNPMVIDAENRNVRSVLGANEEGIARENGHDGFIVYNVIDALGAVVSIGGWSSAKPSTLFVVFDTDQIKITNSNDKKNFLYENTLYHGTLIDFVPSIKRVGLVPSVGEFVKNAYGEAADDIELDELVFAANKEGLHKAVSAITAQVAHKLNKDFHDVTDEEFIKHGALVKIWDGDLDMEHRPRGDENYYGTHPYTVEPGDYYSFGNVSADEILTGNKMITVLKRYGSWPRDFGPNKEKTMRYFLIRLAIKRNPNKTPKEIVKTIMEWDNRTIESYYYKYKYDKA